MSKIINDIENKLRGRTVEVDEAARLHALIDLCTKPTSEERMIQIIKILRTGLEIITDQSNDDWSLGIAEKALEESYK